MLSWSDSPREVATQGATLHQLPLMIQLSDQAGGSGQLPGLQLTCQMGDGKEENGGKRGMCKAFSFLCAVH